MLSRNKRNGKNGASRHTNNRENMCLRYICIKGTQNDSASQYHVKKND